ncbi:MAG: DNA repair protein RecO [Microscillaceae bacterium]|nr:DNA repair protein RecO [Microscillaceae bacterium]MDW8460121.1 DNA repair protein RecO [Cytophagales bacterium]
MLAKTRGIVLNYIKYSETSIIAKIYTQNFGMQTYIVNGVRTHNKKQSQKISLFQPLTLVDLVVYYYPDTNRMSRIKEIKCYHVFEQISTQYPKMAIAFFMAEVLYKVLKEEEPNEGLFNFLQASIFFLDSSQANTTTFHLHFLCKLTYFLGFEPQSAQDVLDELGQYRKNPLPEEIQQELLEGIDFFISQDFEHGAIPFSANTRKRLTNTLLDFYNLHVATFYPIKSLEVFREIND